MLIALWVVLFGIYFALSRAFRNRLRLRHPETWQRLGPPKAIVNREVSFSLEVSDFLWRSHYRSLADSRLNALALSLKILFAISLVLLMAILLSTFTRGNPPVAY
jgi:hypothetical protein